MRVWRTVRNVDRELGPREPTANPVLKGGNDRDQNGRDSEEERREDKRAGPGLSENAASRRQTLGPSTPRSRTSASSTPHSWQGTVGCADSPYPRGAIGASVLGPSRDSADPHQRRRATIALREPMTSIQRPHPMLTRPWLLLIAL